MRLAHFSQCAIFLLFSTFSLTPVILLADESYQEPKEQISADSQIDNVNKASDASFDNRLPPVLPGEEVRDGGRKMKVWSTSGPVPGLNNVPAVPNAPQVPGSNDTQGTLGSIDVFVDQRNDHDHHRNDNYRGRR